MANENLKDFSVQWILLGLLFLSMITFSATFIYHNSPGAMGAEGTKLNSYSNNAVNSLGAVEQQANVLLNISAQNDPEVSDLGSKDSVAVSYGITGIAGDNKDSLMPFIKWMLAPDPNATDGSVTVSQILLSIFLGMFGIVSLYYIIKWIRNGF